MRVLLLMFGLFASVMSFGQTASRDLFQPLATRPDAATSRSSRESWYRLDEPQLRWALSKLDTRGQTQPVVLWLPDPDGELRPFAVSRSEVMAPELAARFPEIETFQGQAVDGSRATLRFELSPVGFTAMAFVPGRVQLIEPDASTGDYVSFVRERREGDAPFRCSVTGEPLGAKSMPVSTELQRYAQGLIHARPKASGPTLRTYRTAVAATVEYTATFGGTVLGAMRGIATAINRINQVYETEIGVRLVLVPNNAAVVYTVEPDPYTNNNGSTMLGENQTNLTNVIGGANYDVGHVFSTGGGGVAILGSVCNATSKARGVTGLPSPNLDPFWVDYVAHEIGHQLNAPHTFNGSTSNCVQRSAADAYEVGSGSTIMAYAGICGGENLQSNSDPFFHVRSLDTIHTFVQSGGGATCGSISATGNQIPVLTPVANRTIPARTPFALTASATDPDGDPLSYSWEQFDLGTVSNATTVNQDDGTRPLFRSFDASSSPTRLFPRLANILSGTQTIGEVLPTTSRSLNFRVTVRDNRPGGGGVQWTGTTAPAVAQTTLTVVDTGAAFAVTGLDSATTWAAGSAQTVTWNVAGTTAAPISCANVRIDWSTDNGNSGFPIVLLASTPNDGTQGITVPSQGTSAGRVRVGCADNIFFDINNAAITVTGGNAAPTLTLPGATVTYVSTGAAVILDATATVADSDSANFDGGALTLTLSNNAEANDRLEIRNQGNGAGEIGVSGSTVQFGGTSIGSFSGGVGTVPLVVQFNASATPAAAQALLRNITYRSVSQVLGTLPRTVTAQVADGDGGVSVPASELVSISFTDRTIAFNFDDSDANDQIAVGDPLTYTIRFTRDIDLASVSAADFDNAGTATFAIDSITEPSAGTLSVQLRALTTGTLILRIPASATINDVGGPGQILVPAQDENTLAVVTPLVLVSRTVTTNGGVVQPNSCNSFDAQVRNEAATAASNISGFASSSTAAAPIAQPSSAFANAASGATVGNSTPFQFSVAPDAVCGSTINAEIQLNYGGPTGPSVLPVSFQIGALGTVLSENFDGVTAPALPSGWTTSQTGATPPPAFATTTTGANSAPNVAFTNGVATVASNSLVTPAVLFPAGSYNGRLSLQTAWNFESGQWDGGVIEVSTDNGTTWLDVTNPTIGGSFIQGGYNGTIQTGFDNPLSGRSGFVNTQATYQTVTVQFPSSLNGQTLRFRFRGGWDNLNAAADPNWRIDGVVIQAGIACTAGSGVCAANQPSRLAFASQPSNAATNAAISPAVSVRVLDSLGNPTSSTATINVAIANNPGAATLSGSTSAAAVAGVASFASLSLNQPGSGYTLSASSPGLTAATSAAFDIGANNTAGFIVGSITIPATGPATNAATRVRFPQTFPATPVVILQGDNQNPDPQAFRIANVGPTGFEVLQVEPAGCSGCTGAAGAATVHWLAALPGVYRLPNEVSGIDAPGPGVLVKVGSVSTSASQRATARGGFVGWAAPSWQAATFTSVAGSDFSSAPVLLTTLQSWSAANEGSNLTTSPLALRGASQLWLTPAVRNVTATGFDVALESSSSDDNAGATPGINAPETVGYVAIESGVSARLRANAGSLIGLASGTATVTGTCSNQTFTYPAGTAIADPNLRGFAGLQTRNEDDGGWIRRCGLLGTGGTNIQAGSYVDEDADLKADRSHPTAETAGRAVFTGDFTTTPVSLASLESIRQGDQLRVQFSSATEAGHVGFRIWGRASDREAFRALHDDLIVSATGDGMRGQNYSRLLPAAGVNELRIEDVDVLGHSRFHPSVAVGERVGAAAIDQPLDWSAIRRANAAVVVSETRAGGPVQVLAEVRTRGIQRVSHADLAALGLSGVEVGELAVLRAGVPVPRHVNCTGSFTGACTIEFLGEPRESLYGSTMPYVITVNPAAVVEVSGSALMPGATERGIVTATIETAPNRAYSFVSPVADPWYDQRLAATTAPVELQRSFALPARAPGPVQLSVRLWGGLDHPEGGPDHSVELRVNGQQVATRRFDGLVEAVIDVTLDEGLLLASNQLTLRVLADTGHPADVVMLEGFTVRYPRYTDLVDGQLQVGDVAPVLPIPLLADGFEATAASGGGFALVTSAPTTVWTQRSGEAWRRDQITGTRSLRAGLSALVAAHDTRIAQPSLRSAPAPATALARVDYLVITHPLFEAELAPLLALQQARGYSVRVLRTDAIYAARSHHQPDPAALREVVAQIAPRFLLLVGGDSYDYDDHLGLGSQSFLPTFYRPTSAFVRFAPTDLPFVDQNADGAPERAIGRLPVRTVDEARRLVGSILARDSASSSTRYFATAGNSGPGEYFGVHSRSLLSYLRQGQNPDFALADEVGLSAARAAATAALAGAADWINYLGHSSPNRWAFQNLLDTSQLAGINRTGAPAVVAQWGCWNNYFVMPNQDTMSQALLLRPNTLASAVIGATALAEDSSHLALGLRFYDLVEDGRFDGSDMAAVSTLGEALMHAKVDLLGRQPEHRASNDSITLFGDPAMPLRQP